MEQVRRETWAAFERRLDRAGVPAPQRPDYRKWVRFYLDFYWYVPVVLSRSEVEVVPGHLEPPYHLVGLLQYGCGLPLAECVGLRVQCFNLDAMLLTCPSRCSGKPVNRLRCPWLGPHPTEVGC